VDRHKVTIAHVQLRSFDASTAAHFVAAGRNSFQQHAEQLENAVDHRGVLASAGEGADIQAELHKITGSRTVPQVFIAGEFVGGCSNTFDLYEGGKLTPKLDAAGVSHT
jgi:glutaredoxin-related protein